MMDTGTAAAAIGGRLVGRNVEFARVTSDSRVLEAGDLFVALKGERFDGHDFVPAALERGAVAALVSRASGLEAAGTLVEVDDPLAGLGRLAAYWRERFLIPVVAVVGSNGKTTVKEMIAAILRAEHGADHVLATRGNLNNAIGLPLTLLGLRKTHRAAVIELGMNHPGETTELGAIVRPTVALINNAQREHQEFMRSVADVAAEHARLLTCLQQGGVAVLNADDPQFDTWRRAVPGHARTTTFGLARAADVSAEFEPDARGLRLALRARSERAEIVLATSGEHNARNAAGAAAAALSAGASFAAVVEGLQAFRPVPGRLVPLRATTGAVVVDDTYNANPDSVHAAIAVLAGMPAPRWLVLGDMGEVGDEGPAFHREVGAAARAARIDRLLAAGTLAAEAVRAFGAGAQHYESVEALANDLATTAPVEGTVLVKGSRFMRMERVVSRLCGTSGEGGH